MLLFFKDSEETDGIFLIWNEEEDEVIIIAIIAIIVCIFTIIITNNNNNNNNNNKVLAESKRYQFHLPAPKMPLPGHAEVITTNCYIVI